MHPWPPFVLKDSIITTLLLVIANVTAISGGLGGGSLFVPVLLISGLSMTQANPLSNALIFIANLVVVFGNLPFFDSRTGALLIPPMVVGTSIGVFFNLVFPGWLILSVLQCLLLYITFTTWKKAGVIAIAEKAAKIKQEINSQIERRQSTIQRQDSDKSAAQITQNIARRMSKTYNRAMGGPLVDYSAFDAEVIKRPRSDSNRADINRERGRSPSVRSPTETSPLLSPPLERSPSQETEDWELEDEPVRPNSIYYIFALLSTWLTLVATDIGRSHVKPCSPLFWILTCIPLVTAILSTIMVGYFLQKAAADITQDLQEPWYEEQGVIWAGGRTWLFPIWTFCAGVMSGFLGIGGALILGPLLLTMSKKPDPLRTTSISSFAVLFSSSAVTLQYIFLKQINSENAIYFAWYGPWIFFTAIIGHYFTQRYIRKSGRKSIIVYCLAVGTGAAALITLIQVVEAIMELAHDSSNMWQFDWKAICTSDL